MRPARTALAIAVTAAREANAKTPAGRKAARLAAALPQAINGVLLEEAQRDLFELAVVVERLRRIVGRLAGLDRVIGAVAAPPVIVVPPVAGAPARFAYPRAAEIAAAADRWRAFAEALAIDPTASADAHFKRREAA